MNSGLRCIRSALKFAKNDSIWALSFILLGRFMLWTNPRFANLSEISNKTGLTFTLPTGSKKYKTISSAAFYSIGSGYYAMDALATVFQIPKFIWTQLDDGTVFVGSWSDSIWAEKPVQIDHTWETVPGVTSTAKLPAIPALRPGVNYNGAILTEVHLVETIMTVSWSVNPWGKNEN